MRRGLMYAAVVYLAMCAFCYSCAAGPLCAENGESTMDPRLENALKIRLRVPVREPDGTIARPPPVSDEDIDDLWRDIKPREKSTPKPRQLQHRRDAVKHAVKKYKGE